MSCTLVHMSIVTRWTYRTFSSLKGSLGPLLISCFHSCPQELITLLTFIIDVLISSWPPNRRITPCVFFLCQHSFTLRFSSVVYVVSVVFFFFLQLYKHGTICVLVLLLIDIWVVGIFWLFWIKLLWTLLRMILCEFRYSYVGVEMLCYREDGILPSHLLLSVVVWFHDPSLRIPKSVPTHVSYMKWCSICI